MLTQAEQHMVETLLKESVQVTFEIGHCDLAACSTQSVFGGVFCVDKVVQSYFDDALALLKLDQNIG